MDPTISRAMDDRDRMDYLERSITSIRKALADFGVRVEQTEAGYGRVLSGIADVRQVVEGARLDATNDRRFLVDEVARSLAEMRAERQTIDEILRMQMAGSGERVAALQLQVERIDQHTTEQFTFLAESFKAIVANVVAIKAELTAIKGELTALQTRKPWWRRLLG